MTLRLSPSELAAFSGAQTGTKEHQGTSFWSVTEKKFTRYLRRKRDNPVSKDALGRQVLVPREHAGALFGRGRERIKRIEAKFGIELEVEDDSGVGLGGGRGGMGAIGGGNEGSVVRD